MEWKMEGYEMEEELTTGCHKGFKTLLRHSKRLAT